MTRMPESSGALLQIRSENGFGAEPVVIWKARKYIAERSDEALPLTDVARFVQIHPNYFSEKFKEVTGLNFVDYLARVRVTKATELLKNPALRVSEIAFAVGFQSLSQFNRVFKRLMGGSPTEFRQVERRDATNGDGVIGHGDANLRSRARLREEQTRLPKPACAATAFST